MVANLDCTGREETLLDCRRPNSYGILRCYGYELAGVECEGTTINSCLLFMHESCSIMH